MFFDPLYLILAIPGMVLGLWAQMRVKSAFNKWSRVATSRGMTGAQVAAAILQTEGITGVSIEPVRGFLTDHYHPGEKALRLSNEVFNGRSVAAAGIAAHEVGHAVQHARGYAWLGMRSALVPVVSFTSRIAMPMFFGGWLLGGMSQGNSGLATAMVQIGAIAFAGAVVFQLVTLPVEFDASRRALAAIDKGRIVTGEEYKGARQVLSAAALTYVAAAMQAVMTLLYFLIRAGLIGGNDD